MRCVEVRVGDEDEEGVVQFVASNLTRLYTVP